LDDQSAENVQSILYFYPGIESRWGGEIFRTRPDRQWWLPGHSRG